MIFLHAYIGSLIRSTFVESAYEFDQDILERARCPQLAQCPRQHSPIRHWWTRSIVLSFGFWERVVLLYATDSPEALKNQKFIGISGSWNPWPSYYYLPHSEPPGHGGPSGASEHVFWLCPNCLHSRHRVSGSAQLYPWEPAHQPLGLLHQPRSVLAGWNLKNCRRQISQH